MHISLYFLLCVAGIGLVNTETQSNEDESPKLWAVLVAGSNGYYNYRHQADVCHAYQIVHAHGIPDERIIVMMYDDIARNKENPVHGNLINHPAGPNVYVNVPKDYTGDDVSPENFVNVITGNAEAMAGIGSGKVLQSGPNDHVFINFVDHGATGLIAFPNGELTVKELHTALLRMHTNKMFAKLVFYMEACESGSMFKNTLPNNINIYATTAANYNESSYACYFDKKRDTFLGDKYSVDWMEDSDKENLEKETLLHQFTVTKRETNTSHVEEYGDLNIGQMHVAKFQGQQQTPLRSYPKVPYDAVDAIDAPLVILMKRFSYEEDPVKRQHIHEQIMEMHQKRSYVEQIFKSVVSASSRHDYQAAKALLKAKPKTLTHLDCHTNVVHSFSQICINLGQNPYALKYVFVLANMCEKGMDPSTIIEAMHDVCDNLQPIQGAN